MANANNWMQYMQNPKGYLLNKYVFDLIKERYWKHQPVLERIGHYMVTEDDMKQFTAMLVDVYEAAYLKAVDDHKEALAKAGLKATVVAEKQKQAGSPK